MPLQTTDITEGTAAAAMALVGKTVSVHCTGWLFDLSAPGNKDRKFDSSRDRGDVFGFELGAPLARGSKAVCLAVSRPRTGPVREGWPGLQSSHPTRSEPLAPRLPPTVQRFCPNRWLPNARGRHDAGRISSRRASRCNRGRRRRNKPYS